MNIVFGQLPDLLGVDTSGGVASQKAWYIATHPSDINWAAAAVGISALLVLFGLARTRFALFCSLVAVVVPTAIVALLDNTSVATVSDEGAIPTGLPPLALPHLEDLSIGVVSGALAIAAIALVQGAGVAESAPNPDGSPSHSNGEFIGQGWATSRRAVPRHPGRRVGRVHCAERVRRCPQPLVVGVRRALDAGDPWSRCPAWSVRWRCRRSVRC